MNESKVVDEDSGAKDCNGPYTIYSAGGLFTQDELGTNLLIKEAVWRLSNGKFQLFLPQSRELRELDRPDVEIFLRNIDLLEIVKADIILARFDGLELETGTVVEYAIAKSLGKPAVILRCDFRRLSGTDRGEPYNLMVKNWPRTVEVHVDSFVLWSSLLGEARQALQRSSGQALDDSETFEAIMKTEISTVQKSVDEVAKQVIAGLEAVIKMKSPYPPAYQEDVYKAFRFCPGSSFDQLLTESELGEIIQRLRKNGTL